MDDKNKSIDRFLRRQRIRKWVRYTFFALVFVGFMSYALYREHGAQTRDDGEAAQENIPVQL